MAAGEDIQQSEALVLKDLEFSLQHLADREEAARGLVDGQVRAAIRIACLSLAGFDRMEVARRLELDPAMYAAAANRLAAAARVADQLTNIA